MTVMDMHTSYQRLKLVTIMVDITVRISRVEKIDRADRLR